MPIQGRVKGSTLFCSFQINIHRSNKLTLLFQLDVLRHTQSSLSCKMSYFWRLFDFFSVALLVEIANTCVSGVAKENIPYPCLINWSTTRFLFIFHLSFWGWHHFLGQIGNSFLKVKVESSFLKGKMETKFQTTHFREP